PGLAQVAAVGARELGPEYTEGVRAEYQKRRDLLYEGLSRVPGVFLRKPEGAFYFVARLPVDDAEEFARWLLTDFQRGGATVMVAPAEGFYATPGLGRNEVRIAYVLKEDDLRAAVEILAAALPAYREARKLDAVRARLRALAARRLDAQGRLLVTSQRTRDQHRNLEDAREKVRALVRRALVAPKRRKPTRVTAAAKAVRLSRKRRRSERKRARGPVRGEGD